MVTITIGKTAKRINSTSNSFISGTSKNIDVYLKEPSSSIAPVFVLHTTGASGIGSSFYNYLKWGDWYYWIDDIVYLTADTCEIHTHLDPLATFKSAITSTYALCSYADSSHWNNKIDDIRFNPEVFNADWSTYKDIFPFKASNTGCIIMTFAQTASLDWADPNHTVTTPCGIHTAILTWTDFKSCLGDMINFGDTIPNPSLINTIGDACMEIIQAFARAMESTGGAGLLENIIRCIWLPFDYTDVVTSTGATNHVGLQIGGVIAPNISWYEIPQTQIYVNSDTIQIPIDTITDGFEFMRNRRFTSVQVVTPAGYAQIPSEVFLRPANDIDFHYKSALSLSDGAWALKISSTEDHRDSLASFSGNLGVNLMGMIYDGPTTSSRIGDMVTGITKTALTMGIGSMMGAAFAGESMTTFKGYTAEGIKSYASHLGSREGADQLMSGIEGIIPNNSLNVSMPSGDFGGSAAALFLGDRGSGVSNPGRCYVYVISYGPKMIVDDTTSYASYCDEYGYPCNDYLLIGSITGYVKCAGASCVGAAGMPAKALSMINSYLNSGLYIE